MVLQQNTPVSAKPASVPSPGRLELLAAILDRSTWVGTRPGGHHHLTQAQHGEPFLASLVLVHPERRPAADGPHLAEPRIEFQAARSPAAVAVHHGDYAIIDLGRVL